MNKVLILSLAFLLWGLISLGFLIPPCLLLILSCTLAGKLAALFKIFLILFFAIIPLLLVRRLLKVFLLLSGAFLFTSLASFGTCWSLSPKPCENVSSFSGHFTGKAEFKRLSPANLVPEEDQLIFGAFLAPFFDKFMTYEQGCRLASLLKSIYGGMNDEFRNTPSALGFCYKDLFEGERQLLHLYEYIPDRSDGKPCPVLIFLHGSLGNFKAYSWILKDFADKSGVAVFAPTYGCGKWTNDSDGLVLAELKKHINADKRLDGKTKYIAGLSNGGIGVLDELTRAGNEYKSCVLISAVTDESVLNSASFRKETAAVQFLIIHGEMDERVPLSLLSQAESILKDQGKHVGSLIFKKEDHFVFFSKRFEIINGIESFIGKTPDF